MLSIHADGSDVSRWPSGAVMISEDRRFAMDAIDDQLVTDQLG
jgi:hypothetical protein